jgi:hypothetical protein
MGCTILPKLAARTKGEGESLFQGTNPEKNREGEPIRRRIPAPFFQLFFGGQQGDGRLFNSKFSKDLHVWLKLSLGF